MNDDKDRPSEGAVARARRLLDGLVERLERGGLAVRTMDDGSAEVVGRGRVVARMRPVRGQLEVDLDAKAGVGDPVLVRRQGVRHPDRARAAAGWRRVEIHHGADANRLLEALRPRGGRGRAPHAPLPAVVVGQVRVRRLEDPAQPEDGCRVLVEASWPRGLPRDAVQVEHWWPQAAPSPTLRKAYGNLPVGQRGFRRAYLAELKGGPKAEVVSRLRHLTHVGALTLLVTMDDLDRTHAVVLADAVSRPKTPRV